MLGLVRVDFLYLLSFRSGDFSRPEIARVHRFGEGKESSECNDSDLHAAFFGAAFFYRFLIVSLIRTDMMKEWCWNVSYIEGMALDGVQ